MKSESCNFYPAVSPNGRWMAYDSNVSGREEIYIERYPELGDRHLISTGGGHLALWSRDGRELFFSSWGQSADPGGPGAIRDDAQSPGVRKCCSNSRCSQLRAKFGRTTSPPMDGS